MIIEFLKVFTMEKYQTDKKKSRNLHDEPLHWTVCYTIINAKQIHFIYCIHFISQIIWSQSEMISFHMKMFQHVPLREKNPLKNIHAI